MTATESDHLASSPARVGVLHHVAVSVADMEASTRFYGEGLGLRRTLETQVGNDNMCDALRIPRGSRARMVYFQGPERVGQVELIQWNIPQPADSRPKRPGDPGVFSLSFNVTRPEVDEIHERLVGMGVTCYSAPGTNVLDNYGPVTRFLCEDPDGIMVEIINLPTDDEVRAFRSRAKG